jgi:hypothetical protein
MRYQPNYRPERPQSGRQTQWENHMGSYDLFSYDDPEALPLTEEQKQHREEEVRRNMRASLDYLKEHPPKTKEQLAQEPPEFCAQCGEIAEAHYFDGERIHCPDRVIC